MELRIDRSNPLPLGEQIAEQIRRQVDGGELEPGAALPTIRAVAAQLGVNANTVAAVYRQLEEEGYVSQRKRAGTSVVRTPPRSPERILARHIAGGAVARAQAAGIDATALAHAVAAAGLGDGGAKPRLAALAGSPLEAAELAVKADALLGETFSVVPVTPAEYRSVDYHLTVVHPALTGGLAVRPQPTPPRRSDTVYGPDFPAGAD